MIVVGRCPDAEGPLAKGCILVAYKPIKFLMGREYKITCTPLRGSALSQMLLKLPSPIQRPQMWEIYNYSVEEDGYYFVDHLVDRSKASAALHILIDAALSIDQSVTVSEP